MESRTKNKVAPEATTETQRQAGEEKALKSAKKNRGSQKDEGDLGDLEQNTAPEQKKPEAVNGPEEKPVERADLVRHLAKLIEERIGSKDYKPTVADFLKLIEYEEASHEQEARKVEVRWVDQKD